MATFVRDIMDAEPVTVAPDAPVETVIRTLREAELPGVPVVNEGGRCVGIITESDLVLAGEEEDLHLPHYFELFGGLVFLETQRHFEERLRKAVAATAADMMTPDPITVEASATVQEAAHLISQRKHDRIPVVESGRFVGMVTRLDVLTAG